MNLEQFDPAQSAAIVARAEAKTEAQTAYEVRRERARKATAWALALGSALVVSFAAVPFGAWS